MVTGVYEVHFPDGHTKELVVNILAEAIYAPCDPDDNQNVILDSIMYYQKNPDVAISCHNQVKIVDGKKVVSHSTQGWELCFEWKDDSISWYKLSLSVTLITSDDIAYWQKLSDLKESHPLQVTEFVLAIDIPNEPA
ncbi:hypothetical protein ACHAW6_004053 [Cyclotella cf. meneghiniana]